MELIRQLSFIITEAVKTVPSKTITTYDPKLIAKAIDDIKTLIAILAAIVAIVFGTITALQKIHDKRIALRKQLTEILEKILDKNLEAVKYRSAKDTNTTLPENYFGLLHDYTRMYVEHAYEIVKQIPKRVSSHELTVLAWAFTSIDDNARAEKYFELSVKRSKNKVEEILAKRNYARFLFSRINIKKGNAYFDSILNEITASDQIMIYYRAETFIRWAKLHEEIDINEYKKLLNLAEKEFGKLDSELRRKREITKINEMINTTMSRLKNEKSMLK